MNGQENNPLTTSKLETNPKRGAIYMRVSTADQNPELQLGEIQDYATRQAWHVIDIYRDIASGAKAHSKKNLTACWSGNWTASAGPHGLPECGRAFLLHMLGTSPIMRRVSLCIATAPKWRCGRCADYPGPNSEAISVSGVAFSAGTSLFSLVYLAPMTLLVFAPAAAWTQVVTPHTDWGANGPRLLAC